MPITQRTLDLEARLRRDLIRLGDQHDTRMLRAWAAAWDEVAPDLEATLLDLIGQGNEISRATLLRSVRLRKQLAIIADKLDELSRKSQVSVTGDLRGVVDAAGAAQAQIIRTQLPSQAYQLVDLDAWSRVDSRQLEAIVRRSTQQITARHKPLSRSAYVAVQRELVRGVAAGSNPRETARRIVKRTEGEFNGGLSRATNIARTETIDAHRAAAQLGQAQHADVLKGWVWSCTLSARTCRSCLAEHGTVHPLSEPGPLDHQSGRCARVPEVKSWSELGFDGITEPDSALPSSQEYFTGLDRVDQERILGKDGRAAWARGDWPMEKWSVRRKADGWRDSYAPAKPPRRLRKTA